MAGEQRLKTPRQMGVFFSICMCMVFVVLNSGFVLAGERKAASRPARYRVFSLRHISASQGRELLAEAEIGTVSQLPGSEALLVTADPAELVKASAILQLVDANEPFAIKAICPASEADSLPSNDKIEAELGDISIGTFSTPPVDAAAKAIIDIHNDAVVAVAPAGYIEKIIVAIEKLQASSSVISDLSPAQRATEEVKELPQTQEEVFEVPEAGPEAQDTNNSDEFFSKLIKSLAGVEEAAQSTAQSIEDEFRVGTEPNQPSGHPIDSEPLQVDAERLQEPNLPVRRQQIEEHAVAGVPEELEPEVESEFAPERVVVEVNQPDEAEVTEPAAAVLSYAPQPLDFGNETLELDLPEKLNVVDLFDLVGKYLHLDYMYDDTKVKGEVALKVQGPIKVKDLYPLLESVLKFKGFVMARKGNLVTIVPADEALNIDPALLDPAKGELKYGDVIITRLFDLDYVDTTSAKNLLDGMKLGVNITPIAGTGTLIVTGYAYRMARIEELLLMIDKPGAPRQFRFRQLKYTMAKTLAPKVKTLVEQMGIISITIARSAAGPAQVTRRQGESTAAFRRRQTEARRAAQRGAPAPAEAAKPTVYLDADERTNRILMIGLEDELDTVEELIDTLDVAQQDLRVLRLYEIQHVGAEDVKTKLAELGIIGGKGAPTRITAAARDARQPAAARPAAAAAVSEPLVEEPQVIIIESTNSLLVNATEEQHAQIVQILAYVDSRTFEEAIPYKIYPLENQKPEDLATVLNQLVQETVKDKEGKIQQVVKKQEEIIIIPDEKTFSLIVYASKKNQEWIGSLIKTLDKRRPQVLIDVTLVEVSRTDLFELDLQFATKFPKLQTDGVMKVADSIISPFVGGMGEVFSSPVTGKGQGFYSDAHIQALLTAIQTKSYGRVLAKPKILVNDGETGVIKTTDTTHVKIEDFVIPQEGNIQKKTSYTPYPAGITLTITPNISEGDLLLLEVELDRTDFGETPEAGAPPDTTSSNIDTIVTVPNDRTIILGGLLKLNQSKGGTKVPLLGDIPLLGGLFRSTSNSARDTKLYVFVKANILRPDETLAGLPELERISERSRIAFEKSEDEFQGYHDWPGVEPHPIEPLRVLEAE